MSPDPLEIKLAPTPELVELLGEKYAPMAALRELARKLDDQEASTKKVLEQLQGQLGAVEAETATIRTAVEFLKGDHAQLATDLRFVERQIEDLKGEKPEPDPGPDEPEPPVSDTPAKPTGLHAETTAAGVSLIWPAVERARFYRVFRGTTPDFEASPETRIEQRVFELHYLDTTAKPGRTCWYRIRAVEVFELGGGFSGSEPSDAVRVDVPEAPAGGGGPPAPPADASEHGYSGVRMRFDD